MLTNNLQALAQRIRADIIRSTTAAGSGHLTSSLSAVEIMTGLFFGGTFHADLRRPDYPNNDRFILSKGHAAPLLYALYVAAGMVPERMLRTLRHFGSQLEGHPMPRFKYTEVPTGSLGQGLGVGVGEALAARIAKLTYRTYVLLGDSEMAEGSVWEAIEVAAYHRLDSLVAILDLNGLGQSGPTMLGRDAANTAKRVAAFGWRTIIIDGHDLERVRLAFIQASKVKDRPTMIIARTVKGKGVPLVEGKSGWHGRVLNQDQARVALKALGPVERRLIGRVSPPVRRRSQLAKKQSAHALSYRSTEIIAPRMAIGQALTRLGAAWPQMIVLDGEVKNSTGTESFERKYPRRFVEGFIAEQNLVSMADGLAARGLIPVVATFAAFLTRAADQLRMNQYARTHQVYIGTHAGVHIGQDGASQMGLQDIAMFRDLEHSTILYPADGNAAVSLLGRGLQADGMVYLRATRAELPILYRPNQRLHIGGSTVFRQSRHDRVTIVAVGVTVHEALRAAELLSKHGIATRVIDLYSLKPLDVRTLQLAARQTKHLIVVEDHYPAGGIAEAVRSALGTLSGCVTSLAVTKTPHSGRPEELLRDQGIDAAGIVRAVRRIIRP